MTTRALFVLRLRGERPPLAGAAAKLLTELDLQLAAGLATLRRLELDAAERRDAVRGMLSPELRGAFSERWASLQPRCAASLAREHTPPRRLLSRERGC